MEIKINQGSRIAEILKGQSPSEWLTDKGYIYYKDISWIKQDRIDVCRSKGFISFNYEGGLVYTKSGCSVRVWKYLNGDSDSMDAEQVNKTKWEAKPVKEKVDAEEMFKDMIE
jgi:hypothetical protein